MSFAQGINFRSTAGYVADGTTEYGQTALPVGGNYPTTTAQGNTVGWEGTAYLQLDERDRSTSVDQRLAGVNFTKATGVANYRIDLPSSGAYNVRLAAGDAIFAQQTQVELFDGTSSLGILASGSTAAGQFMDAAGVAYSAAAWPSSNALVAKTFSSTICRVAVGAAGVSNKFIAHFYVEAASGSGSTDTPVGPGAGTLTLAGFAPSIAQSANQSVAPASGAVSLTGFAPSVTQSASGSAAPGSGSLTITGFAPSVVQAGSIALTLGAASLSLVGYAPTVTQSGVSAGGAPGYGDRKPRRKYVVRRGEYLYTFRNPEAAEAFLHADDEPEAPVKQYPAKKQAKQAPKVEPKPAPVPEQRVDLTEVRALAQRMHAEAEYQQLMAQKRYEAMLVLLERLREEEEDDWLLMAAD